MKSFISRGYSSEQRAIIAQTRASNVIVDAVAGSGKTHTVSGICDEWKNETAIVVTYNKRLQVETLARVGSNAKVLTYHGLAGQIFGRTCRDDAAILKKLVASPKTISCDILIIDEAQDMTPILYRLIKRVNASRIVVMGDPRQCVYDFMDADPRFLTFADTLLKSQPVAEWTRMSLSFTFRFGKNIAAFVNGMRYQGQQIAALPTSNEKVTLVESKRKNPRLAQMVIELVQRYGANRSMIIAKHTTNNRAVLDLVESLSVQGIPILIAGEGDSGAETEKLLVTTITKSKGLERDLVVVMDFDFGLEAYQRQKMPQYCPNSYYVAATRAKKHLLLVRDSRERPLEFVDFTLCEHINLDQRPPKTSNVARVAERPKISVTDLVKHVPSALENEIYSVLTIKEPHRIRKPVLQLPSLSRDEFVADITGTAVPAYYEALKNGKLTFAGQTKLGAREAKSFTQRLLKDAVQSWSKRAGTDYRARQIKSHDWISVSDLNECVTRLDSVVGSMTVTAEVPIVYEASRAHIVGFGDLELSQQTLVEVKMTNDISRSHFLQLAAYASGSHCQRFLIYYVLQDRLFELKKTPNLPDIVDLLVSSKLDSRVFIDDASFLTSLNFEQD